MTLFYSTSTWSSQPQISEKTKNLWEQASQKANWRIVQLPNGYYQTEFKQDEDWTDVTRRETIEGAEQAIDASVEHYSKKLEFVNGPKIVKTFE
jgi:hypothetical protein|tara:strand:- start:60 stop:341 length:282 start_codon:yes stop_codon:yes gene_type:complete